LPGHGKGYWKASPESKRGCATVGSEGFAEMAKAAINHLESLRRIKLYFPKSYDIFMEMLENMRGL